MVQYVRLGASTSRAPEALRLTLIGTRRRAEVFFNLFPDGRRATFLERGRSETRAALLAALAEGLRDGPKPPRTSTTDPNMISDLPFAKAVHPLTSSPVLGAACGEHTFFAAVRDGWNSKLVAIDPSVTGAPRTITTFEGALESMAGSPDGRQVAVLVVRTSNPDQVQPGDVRELRLIDVESGTPIMISTVDEAFRGTGLPIWSKQTMALEGRTPTTSPGDRVTRVYSSQIGNKTLSLVAETEGRLHVRPLRFEGDQIVLASWETQPRPQRRTFLWTIGSPPVAKESIPFASPDGRFAFTIDEDKVIAKDGRAFVSTDVDDKLAIRQLDGSPPIWLGKHALALRSDFALALDLETMHVQPLLAGSDSTLACVTGDGKKALLVGADGTAVVADLPTDP